MHSVIWLQLIQKLTSDHDGAQLCQSQDVNSFGTLWLHQVLHHQQAQEQHVFLYLPSAKRHTAALTFIGAYGLCLQNPFLYDWTF